jgi:hypothetical protein
MNSSWFILHVVLKATAVCYVGWLVSLVYSCCSHLEHRASVKHFISLQFLNLRHSVGLLGRVLSPSQGRYLTQTRESTQTSMPRVVFETTIPAFEQAKTVHALDRAAALIGNCSVGTENFSYPSISVLLRMHKRHLSDTWHRILGCVIAQAVSVWLLIATARVHS